MIPHSIQLLVAGVQPQYLLSQTFRVRVWFGLELGFRVRIRLKVRILVRAHVDIILNWSSPKFRMVFVHVIEFLNFLIN